MFPYITALLPMKGISERVPNKNIRLFAGEPLFYHVLNKLDKVIYINKIIINTDSIKIKELANSFQKVVFHDRPPSICGGHIPMNKIIEYDILKSNDNFYLQTHSTNPLIYIETIDKAIEIFFLNLEKYDSLFSVNKIQQRLYDKNFKPINHESGVLKNTQELDPMFIENSCMYLFSKTSFFENNKNRIGRKPYAYIMSQQESYDIDTEDDFEMAERIFLAQQYKNNMV